MNLTWKNTAEMLGAQVIAGAEIRFEQTSDITSPIADVIALPLLSAVDCNGCDCLEFLHNQLTSDVRHLDVGNAQRAAWCSAKGRMIASFVILRTASLPARFTMLLSADLAAPVIERLKKYVLRSQVEIDDLSERLLVFALLDRARGGAVEVLTKAGYTPPQLDRSAAFHPQMTLLRMTAEHYLLLVPGDEALACFRSLQNAGARAADTNEWKIAEINAGIPWITAVTREELVPQMADFDRLGAISFNKGCYPGQEVVARTHYLGKIKRRLFRIAATGALRPGMPLFSRAADDPDRSCGTIVNSAGLADGTSTGLAVLNENLARSEITVQAPEGALVSVTAIAYPE